MPDIDDDNDQTVPIIQRGPRHRGERARDRDDDDDDQSGFPLTEHVAELSRGETMRRRMLEQTADIIDGRRDNDYGTPYDSFSMIAAFWSDLRDEEFTVMDVAMMMALVKVARLQASGGDHDDSWMDLAGYAACGYEVAHISRMNQSE